MIQFLLSLIGRLFKGGTSWLAEIATGVTHGAIRGVVEAKNSPQKVRRYGVTEKRRNELRAKLAALRAKRLAGDPDAGV